MHFILNINNITSKRLGIFVSHLFLINVLSSIKLLNFDPLKVPFSCQVMVLDFVVKITSHVKTSTLDLFSPLGGLLMEITLDPRLLPPVYQELPLYYELEMNYAEIFRLHLRIVKEIEKE